MNYIESCVVRSEITAISLIYRNKDKNIKKQKLNLKIKQKKKKWNKTNRKK